MELSAGQSWRKTCLGGCRVCETDAEVHSPVGQRLYKYEARATIKCFFNQIILMA